MPRFDRGSPYNRVYAYELSDDLRQRKYFFERFSGVTPVILRNTASLTALPTAAQGQIATMITPGTGHTELFQTTAQTLQPVGNATKGLVIDGDQVDNESFELVPGGNYTNSPYAMTVGTDTDFFFRVRLEITDTSGSDQLLIGWRRQQTFGVPVSFLTTGDGTYTDFAGIGFASTKANPNPVVTATDLNDSASTTVTAVSFTWADTLIHDLEVRVVGSKALYFINGNRIGNPIAKDALGAAITSQSTVSGASFTFDSTDVLVPFVFVRQDADLLDAVYLREWEGGHLTQRGLDPSNE